MFDSGTEKDDEDRDKENDLKDWNDNEDDDYDDNENDDY